MPKVIFIALFATFVTTLFFGIKNTFKPSKMTFPTSIQLPLSPPPTPRPISIIPTKIIRPTNTPPKTTSSTCLVTINGTTTQTSGPDCNIQKKTIITTDNGTIDIQVHTSASTSN